MEDENQQELAKKKRTFRKYTYRGVDLDQLLDMSSTQLMELMHCRARRRYARGLKRKPLALIKKLRRAKKECGPLEKPEVVKTHLRDMLVVPEMVGSIVGVYNGKAFNQVEIKVRQISFASPAALVCGCCVHMAAHNAKRWRAWLCQKR